jgi:hypothetical protein
MAWYGPMPRQSEVEIPEAVVSNAFYLHVM